MALIGPQPDGCVEDIVTYDLPWGVKVILAKGSPSGGGSIEHPDLTGREFDGMMSLVLALGCAGYDLKDPRFIEAYMTAIDAIANNMEDDDGEEPEE